MSDLSHDEIMQAIHGTDIFAGYSPVMVEHMIGWNSEHPSFDDIIAEVRPAVVIDVGVWTGASSIYMAELLRKNGIVGTVISVDTFLGSVEHSVPGTERFSMVIRRHGLPLLYEQFLSNLFLRGMTKAVVPLPQTSTTAALLLGKLGIRAGMVHIDASHEYDDVIRDVRMYWDLLLPGGYLVGDDYDPFWAGVVRAANEFSAEKGVNLAVRYPKWILRKPAA